jgi:multisubunit Na+/H+ antiporter MnhF subunit
MNPVIISIVSALLLYIGLYLYRKCENPEVFDRNTAIYAITTGVVVFIGLYTYQTKTVTETINENIMTTPYVN